MTITITATFLLGTSFSLALLNMLACRRALLVFVNGLAAIGFLMLLIGIL